MYFAQRKRRRASRRRLLDHLGLAPISMLAIEATDEWLVCRSYISQKSMVTLSDSGPEKDISPDNNDEEVDLIAA